MVLELCVTSDGVLLEWCCGGGVVVVMEWCRIGVLECSHCRCVGARVVVFLTGAELALEWCGGGVASYWYAGV